MGGSEEDVWHRVMLVAAVGGRSDPAAFLLSESRKVAYLLQKKQKNTEKISRAFTRCLWRLLRKNSPFDL